VRPTCLIYSLDCYDLGELTNLWILYRRLGFRVRAAFRGRLTASDLLVVVRGSDIEADSLPKDQLVHVYNYVGYDMSRVFEKAGSSTCLLIAPSRELIDRHAARNYVLSPPPVFPDRWICRWGGQTNLKRFRLAFVGTNKRIMPEGGDAAIWSALEKLIRREEAHVWGRGWEGDGIGSRYMGVVSPYNIHHLYARVDRELGVMRSEVRRV